MKILQINTNINSGSTGRIAEDIGVMAMEAGHQSYIAAAKTHRPTQSMVIKIGNDWDRKLHGLKTRLFDRHGFGSANATRHFVKQIEEIQPDIIHLHNIHGYYLNIAILFEYLKMATVPVVWTFHDAWPFTGHCSYFDAVNCYKWKSECHTCPNLKGYPASWWIDNSRKNFSDKKKIFTGVDKLQVVTPSNWLKRHVKNSFLNDYPVRCIHNGIDLETFKPVKTKDVLDKYEIKGKVILLGIASIWDKRKGLNDFIKISSLLSSSQQIVLIGLSQEQMKSLPSNITGILRTENMTELATLYSAASVFINPTYVDNFPTTNIEALACGTPVITYDTGGSPEAIDGRTGVVVEKGNIEELAKAINVITNKGKEHYQTICRERAEQLFDKNERFNDYLKLYDELLEK